MLCPALFIRAFGKTSYITDNSYLIYFDSEQ
jgi:hypothetical protein